MKWILLALIFISGIYYLISDKKRAELEESQHVAILQKEDILPVKTEKVYIMKFSRRTLETMRNLTNDVNPEVRFAAAEILWQIQDEQVIAIIKRMLEMETEKSVRIKIIDMLAKDKTKISLALLAEALKSYDKTTRIRAVEALGKFANREAIPVLNIALNDYDEEVRVKALKAINNIRKDIETHKEMQLKQKQAKPIFKVE